MYVDYLLLVGRASLESAQAMWSCLEQLCQWSGQRVNKDKSNILVTQNTYKAVKKIIKDLCGLRSLKGNSIYLGHSLISSWNQTKSFENSRIESRGGWRVGKVNYFPKLGKLL